MANRYIYRDSKTGRFAKKSTWKRSKKRGGKRYKGEKWQRKPPPKAPPPVGQVFEWIVGFEYKKSGRSFDVIVTAVSETQAYETAREFLVNDAQGRRIVMAGFHGWKLDIAKGSKSDEEAGKAEYRSKRRGKKHKKTN